MDIVLFCLYMAVKNYSWIPAVGQSAAGEGNQRRYVT